MSGGERSSVLLVDDDPTWVLLVGEMLSQAGDPAPSLQTAANLSEAIASIGTGHFDVVLLDLNLPESRGLATLEKFAPLCANAPIVVLTDTPTDALACLRLGADDSLPKSDAQPSLWARVIRYAIERHRLRRLLEETRREVEVRRIEQLAGDARTRETSRLFAGASLRESYPSAFERCAALYRQLLDSALEARLYQSTDGQQPQQVPELAQELGRLRSSPRDVLDVHMSAIKQAMREHAPSRGQALLEEGRITVLNLMGHLAAFYRNYYTANGPRTE